MKPADINTFTRLPTLRKNYLVPVQHVEFFHRDHFEYRYHRKKAGKTLSPFIDFFWETDFDPLYEMYPNGFSDALFPNVGYTYLINLGTPFVMQLEDKYYDMKSDGFLPRHKPMVCHHTSGNRIFGIKFRVSPVLFEKKINFSEYREYIFPLSYLIDRTVVEAIKKAPDFHTRMQIASAYYESLIARYSGSLRAVDMVTGILNKWSSGDGMLDSVESVAQANSVSTRTLQRYFEATTSITSKQAFQILRIRKAIEDLTSHPATFRWSNYGYYDHSHFYKHMRQFLDSYGMGIDSPHLQLLRSR